jgi:hypothetical protein
LTNEELAAREGWPLLEDVVPADFSGSTGIIACPEHGYLITDGSVKSQPAYGLPGGMWAKGISVQMPFSLLRAPYSEYLRLSVTRRSSGCQQRTLRSTFRIGHSVTRRALY